MSHCWRWGKGMTKKASLLFAAAILFFAGCTKRSDQPATASTENAEESEVMQKNVGEEIPEEPNYSSLLLDVLAKAEIPQDISLKIQESMAENSDFIQDISGILQDDPYLWILVDKEHSLPENYEPDDLVKLKKGSYKVNKNGLSLRNAAAASLEEMAVAAKSKKLTLTVSSAYRSYKYQTNIHKRSIKTLGQKAADRGSARPGYSQHQLGLVVDFGTITDAFAKTAEGRWLLANASSFGWSLSYPQGYEKVTGYRWESWHYRYTGKELAKFIETYFDGIQQYALRFLHEWVQATALPLQNDTEKNINS